MELRKKVPSNIDKLLKILSQENSLLADIYLESEENLSIIIELERIDNISWGKEEGIAFRKINENFQTHFLFTSLFDEQFLEDLVRNIEREREIKGIYVERKLESQMNKKYEEFLEIRLKFLEELKKRIKKAKEIKHYRLVFSETKKETLIFTNEEDFQEDKRFYCKLGIIVVAERDGKLDRGYEVVGKTLTFEEFKNLSEILELPEKVSNLALTMLDARKAPAGIMPVVLSGTAGGTMIHEAVGHGLEADHAEEGFSVYSGRIGEKVASELITVVDNPTLSSLYGSYRFDDEGVPSQKTILIEKGILKNFLYDKYFALKYGKKPNGHGRRQNYRYIPLPRMSNTYIEKGPHKPEEIIKSIEKGLLVKKMGGGEVNPLTGDFVFEVREGYYIEKGEIAYPVKGATLVGNGPKVLEIIDMVGDDLGFSSGTCGKDGQGVPVADGQPTIRIPEIVVGGTLS